MFSYSFPDSFLAPIPVSEWLIFCCVNLILLFLLLLQKKKIKKIIKKIYFIKHIQSIWVDNFCVSCLVSRTNLVLSIMIWCFRVLWTFSVFSNIIMIHLLNLVEVGRVQTISYTELYRNTEHLEVLNQYSLTPAQV